MATTTGRAPDGNVVPADMRLAEAIPADELRRRRSAILALATFAALFFTGWIVVTVTQALVQGHGLGIGDGYVIPNEVGDQSGKGWLGDAALLAMAVVVDVLVIGAWGWLIPRLSTDARRRPTDVEVAEEEWYIVPIPRLTKVLVVIGIACAAAVAISGAILFPVVLIRYGI